MIADTHTAVVPEVGKTIEKCFLEEGTSSSDLSLCKTRLCLLHDMIWERLFAVTVVGSGDTLWYFYAFVTLATFLMSWSG